MKCPKCQFANPEGVNFCVECGNKLEKICPECGYNNFLSYKFCGGCGHKLRLSKETPQKDLSIDEKLNKIRKYLPKGLTEKILSQRDRIEGERKQVTVMFCDMENFTTLSELLDIEEAYSIVDRIYEILIHKVHDYEGTVNDMTGDGIMALFGAPVALEDAPQRAVRSSLAIHREIVKFSDRLKREKKDIPPIKMRIGIHTGPVVVGTVGNDLRVEFKAVGDTVNLASRVEGQAQPGATYVTEDTYKLIEGLFRFEALGQREVKGKEEPINVYRVIAPSTRRTRFDVSAHRGLTPFVGRERELELLLDGFERTKAGRGQAFSILAEAGVGKSRLLYEFRKAVANEDVTFLEGKCLSYSRGVAYHPIIDILKANFDIRETDRDSEVIEKVKIGLAVLGADEASTLPYLLELLSVKDSGIDQIPMSPAARKDRIMRALRRIVLKGSEIKPLIMAFEDLHWIDKSSEDSLKDLLDSISGANIFLIFTYRPEFVHSWGGKSYHSQLTLNQLSNRESLLMVSHLLGTVDIEKNLEELVLEKAEGVPFFIEEFLKSFKELEIIKKSNGRYQLVENIQEMTIPSTIQDVIMARVDSLPEGAKELLQTGSVIEREFGYELINRVACLQEQDLLSHLSSLKDVELLYERGVYSQSTYIFKHALTREVVYDLILDSKKMRLHEQIANAIEEVYKDNIAEYYEVLAGHYTKSENYEKGAQYSKLADRKAEKAASFPDAIAYAKKRIACLEKLSKTDDVLKKLIDARTTLGLYMFQMFYFIEAEEAIDPIFELAVNSNYKKRLAQIYTIKGTYECYIKEDFFEADRYLKSALNISEEVNDIVSLFFSNAWSGYNHFYTGQLEKSIYYFGNALDINIAANNNWGISAIKTSLSLVSNFQGRVKLGYQTSDEGLRIAEESGDIYSKAGAHTVHGFSWFLIGNLEEAENYLLKGLDFSDRINYLIVSAEAHFILGRTYFGMGEFQKAMVHYEKAIWFLEHGRLLPSWILLTETAMARTDVMKGEKNIDLKLLYDNAAKNKIRLYDGWIKRYIAEILLNIDHQHMSEAGQWIEKAIEADNRNGMMWHLGKDYALYAEFFKRKGDQSKAKENLNKAIKILKKCGADGWVEKFEKIVVSFSN